MNVPLVDLKAPLAATESAWRANLERVLARAQFILGPELEAFEAEFALAMNARYAVGVGSGTAALELCLRDAGVTNRTQQVITSPLTAAFTGIAVLGAGASLRFADVDPETLLLDAGAVAELVTSDTAAIVPVHLYGQPCDLGGLDRSLTVTARNRDFGGRQSAGEGRTALDRDFGGRRSAGEGGTVSPLTVAREGRAVSPLTFTARIIQDACQAHGAAYRGRPLTESSPYVAYSFYPTKNLGCLGDGGAVVTDDADIAVRLRQLRDGGRVDAYVSARAGINARLDEMQCCFLRAFLPHLNDWNARRARIAEYYDEALRGFEPVRPVLRREAGVHHLYVVRTRDRDRLREWLTARGVGTGIHYPVPLHLQPTFEDCGAKAGDLPHAERACREIISLPLHPYMKECEAEYVVDQVRSFF